MIRHIGNKWVVLSEKGKKLGSFASKAQAAKRLGQIEWFKHHPNHKTSKKG